MEYVWFLDSTKHVMANAQHFGRIMRRQNIFEKQCSDTTKRCGIERFQDNFYIYGSILKYINDILTWPKVCNEGITMYIKILECIFSGK
jgi:hypothetical protein